ncbi:MAG: type III-B CRISPR module RAMP protein Cmr4 [Candidatus Diapherotrites archaeon]|nr:type III-B CRISPR module RAMP protein Cmr4 [Candidatus Diapherotrites archaeon]
MKTKLLFLHALSPLHAGTGQGVGVIDLPIAREKATGIPIVPGSSIKGVLRANYDDGNKTAVFGPETANASEHAGSVQISDLRLLFLPVRSLSGTFAWVTSPFLLRRFQRDARMAQSGLTLKEIPTPDTEETCFVAEHDSALVFDNGQRVVLEDLDFSPQPSTHLTSWAQVLAPQIFGGDAQWATLFQQRVCIVHDNVLSYFLETATEVVARIQLEPEKKTVKTGALWYEEALPAESILEGIVVAQPPAKAGIDAQQAINAVNTLEDQLLQVGGSATVGRGLCRIRLA